MQYYVYLRKKCDFLGSIHRILRKIGLEGTSRRWSLLKARINLQTGKASPEFKLRSYTSLFKRFTTGNSEFFYIQQDFPCFNFVYLLSFTLHPNEFGCSLCNLFLSIRRAQSHCPEKKHLSVLLIILNCLQIINYSSHQTSPTKEPSA